MTQRSNKSNLLECPLELRKVIAILGKIRFNGRATVDTECQMVCLQRKNRWDGSLWKGELEVKKGIFFLFFNQLKLSIYYLQEMYMRSLA